MIAGGIFFREYLGNSCICCLFMSIYEVEGSGNIADVLRIAYCVSKGILMQYEIRNPKAYDVGLTPACAILPVVLQHARVQTTFHRQQTKGHYGH